MEQTVPATREKNSTQFLPLNEGKKAPPSISFPLSIPWHSPFARFVAIMSPGVSLSSGPREHRQPGATKKGERGRGKGGPRGETLVVVSMRFIGLYDTLGVLAAWLMVDNAITPRYSAIRICGISFPFPNCRLLFSSLHFYRKDENPLRNRFIVFDNFRILIFFFLIFT